MKKGVIATVILIALIGAGVAAVPLVERYAAERIRAEIERDGAATVGSVEVGLFDRRITLIDIKSNSTAEISAGRWEASGLAWPLGEFLRGRTPLAGFRWGDPLQAERVELRDARVVDSTAGSSWSMGSLVVEGLDIGRYDGNYDGSYRFQVLTARLLGALTMRRLEERNVAFTMPGTGDTFGVAGVVVERYEHGRMATITLAGMEAAAKQGQAPVFRVADIQSSGLDLGRMIATMSSSAWHPYMPLGRAQVERASASGFSGETLSRYGASLGSVTVETVRESDKVSRSRTLVEGFVLSPPLRSLESLQLRMVLQSMGLKELKLALDCAGTEDRGKAELTVDRCALIGSGLGEITLTSRIAQADDAFWRAVNDGDVAALYGSKAVLESGRLGLVDKSLLDRSLKALAAATGQPAATARANLARDIRRYQPAGVLITQDMTRLLDTIARFVEVGGTLTIDAKPERPLGLDRFEYLVSPGADLVNALGLSATLSR